ncbi:MAG: 1-(5-phosphoribosyl)-5-[(5-phosphoribosylamino)methylideneamino]imidazole-4-carboxamide isomerase [Candidatus Humimicrobiaceae bacterium]
MIVIPAIDIIGGACVRLSKGKFDSKKKYFEDPIEVAGKWKSQGAEWLHIIDLDGAKTGKTRNLNIAANIKEKLNLKVQFGGGIRNKGALGKVLDSGIDRAILGTRAIEDFSFLQESYKVYGDRIILSLDFKRNGKILKEGWQKDTSLDFFDFSRKIKGIGIREIIVTDVSRDGMLEGIDCKFIGKILNKTGLKIIVAGGVSKIGDIKALKKLEPEGVSGAIIGKALYENNINLKEAIKAGKDDN